MTHKVSGQPDQRHETVYHPLQKQAVQAFARAAPQCSEEQVQKMRDELPPEAKSQLRASLDGTLAILRETEDLLRQGREDLKKTLAAMPATFKKDYLIACKKCPDLVFKVESPFDTMLRTEDFDGDKAAIRLCKYWEFKVKLFGERAFLPIFRLDGNGALPAQSVTWMRTHRSALILPSDKFGRSVVYFHRGVQAFRPYPALLHMLFYVMCKAAVHNGTRRAQLHGCVILVDTRVSGMRDHFE